MSETKHIVPCCPDGMCSCACHGPGIGWKQTQLPPPNTDIGWWTADDKPVKTVGTAHISMDVQIEDFAPEILAKLFGIENHMDENGQHRIHDVNHWEYKRIGEGFSGYSGLFNKDA